MRIISLVPSHTEILFALGLGDQLVGVTPIVITPLKWIGFSGWIIRESEY